jgi:hypothetical protein
MRVLRLSALALLLPALPTTAAGQVANPLPQATGVGGSYTALARGFSAVHWNPAGLGLADNPRASFTLAPLTAAAGLGPITPADFATYDGREIPYDTRAVWLDRIRAAQGEMGAAGADITFIALSIGPVAVSASSSVRGRVSVAPDVAELLLFGNAGLTGDPRDYGLDGSEFDVAGTSTLAASFGIPVPITLGPLPGQRLALGATVKYTVGHFMAMGMEQGSTLSSDPIEVHVRFPMVHTRGPEDEDGAVGDLLNAGSGFGLDLGVAWQAGIFSAGATIRNVVNTFEWNPDHLRYRPGFATWTADTAYTSFEEQPLAHAPPEVMSRVKDFHGFGPVLAAGGAARLRPSLTVSGEIRYALDETLAAGERTHVGVGGQLTAIPFLPLRAGLAVVSGGYELSGGLGLQLGGAQLAAAAALRETESATQTIAAIGLTFGLR